MRKSLIFLKRPYIYGLAVLLFVISSVGLLSKPLFIPEDTASEVAGEEAAEPQTMDKFMSLADVRQLARADSAAESVKHVEMKKSDGESRYYVTMDDDTVLIYDAISGALIDRLNGLDEPTTATEPAKKEDEAKSSDTPVSSEESSTSRSTDQERIELLDSARNLID